MASHNVSMRAHHCNFFFIKLNCAIMSVKLRRVQYTEVKRGVYCLHSLVFWPFTQVRSFNKLDISRLSIFCLIISVFQIISCFQIHLPIYSHFPISYFYFHFFHFLIFFVSLILPSFPIFFFMSLIFLRFLFEPFCLLSPESIFL